MHLMAIGLLLRASVRSSLLGCRALRASLPPALASMVANIFLALSRFLAILVASVVRGSSSVTHSFWYILRLPYSAGSSTDQRSEMNSARSSRV